MSFFDTISRIIQQGKEMAVKATPSSKQTYNKVTPVNNSQFTSNPLLRTQPLQYQKPVIQQPTFDVPLKAQIPQARTAIAETTPMQSNETMAQTVSQIIQGGKEAVKLGGGLVKDVARGTARGSVAGGTFVGARLLGADVNQANQAQFKPETRLDKFLFGDKPASIQSEGIAPLESLGISPDKATKYGAPFVLGSIALDAFTGGSSKAAKNALQKVASNMTAEDATILRNLYSKPTAKNVLPVARNEQSIISALKLDKLPYTEQKTAVDNILKEYDKRWGGVDEALNPPVKPNRAGAMDVKKPELKKVPVAPVATAPLPVNKKLERFRAGKPSLEAGNIRNPLAQAPEKSPTNNQVVSSGNDSTKVSANLANFIGKNAKTFNTETSFEALDGMVRKKLDANITLKPRFAQLIEGKPEVTIEEIRKIIQGKKAPDGRPAIINDVARTGDKDAIALLQRMRIERKRQGKDVSLREVIDYPELFSAYPSAKNIRVKFLTMDEKDMGSFFIDERGVPTITVNMRPDIALETLKHELQHFIQAKEGFSMGGNPQVLSRSDIQNLLLKQQLRNVRRDKDLYKSVSIKDMEYLQGLIEKTGRGKRLDGQELADIFGSQQEFDKMAFKTYTKLYGEVEANANTVEDLLKVRGPIFGKSKKQFIIKSENSAKLNPIDQLIASNKIRVVSRDGRDVYQVKKGGEWVNKRDEDSAIRAVTPRSPIDVIKTPRTPKITRTEAQYRVTPEQIKDYDSKLTALSGAEAGERVVKNNPDGTFGGYVAKKSTFPSYIDEDLRSRKLFDRYMDGRQGTAEDFNITYPKGSKLDRIDKIIKGRIGVKEIKVRQMSRSRDVARLEQEATDRVIREQKRVERQTSPAFRSVLDEPTQLNKERVAQLEKSAMPTADVVRPSTPYKVDSLANIITKTPLDRKVNIIDYLRTPDRVLNKIGFGKEAKLLRDQYEKYSVELPKNIDKISEWVKRVPKNASERIFQHLDGKAVKLSPTEQKVADEIRAYLKDWADRLGLPEENRVANYITRLFDDQLIKQEFDEDLAKIISGKIPGEVYNPFLQKRLGAKGYKQDVWGALDAYTKRATRKVHLDPALDRIREKAGSSLDFTQLEESQFKYIQRYIDRVQMRPTEVDNAIDNAVKQTLGYRFGQRPVTNVSRFLRRMTYRGMLGANLGSALRNLSQGVNTYAVLGEKYTAIGYAKLLQPASQRELIEQGIFNNNFIEDRVLSSTKKLLQKGDKALWFFFDRAEKINRGSAYLGAKAKGLGKGMNEQEAIDYAKNIVRKTQFSYDAVDQPVALGSDIMKTLFQFQTYTTKQTEFLTEMIKDKNVVGLLRYAIGGYLFVNTVGKALGMSESELIPLWDTITGERKFSPAPALKFPIEVVKAVADTPDKYGNERDLEQKAKDVGKSLIGLIPGGNQIKKTVEGMQANAEGGSFTKAGVKQFEVGQSPAAKLQTVLFGKYANQNAKDYFNKTTTTGDKELDKVIKDQKKADKTTTNKVTAKATQMMLFTKEEQAEQLKEIAKVDKDFAMKVRDKLREENKKKSWSDVDKGIAQLGVENGSRANFVYKKMRELPAEERNAYIKDLHDRKVISDEVLKQIKELHKNRNENSDIIQ